MDNDLKLIWGRTGAGRSWLGSLAASAPVVLAPLVSIATFIALTAFEGSFSSYAAAVEKEGFWTVCVTYGPQLTREGVVAVACWVGFQALLHVHLPGTLQKGQYTPAGHVLTYKLNGMCSWVATHAVYFGLCWFGFLDPAFIARNWSSLIAALNLAGLLAPALAFIKAYVRPTHPDDRKFSSTFVSRRGSRLPTIQALFTSSLTHHLLFSLVVLRRLFYLRLLHGHRAQPSDRSGL